MTENMKKFLEAVSKSDELYAKINTMDKAAIIAAAKALGIDLTEADFAQNGEMDDDELEVVAGGEECGCAFVGGGNGNTNAEKTCYCVAGGGELSKLAGGGCRCACVAAGYGDAVDSV